MQPVAEFCLLALTDRLKLWQPQHQPEKRLPRDGRIL